MKRNTPMQGIIREGLLPMLVLRHIKDGYDYAYGIMANLERDGFKLSNGTVYAALKRYELEGFVESTEKNENPRVRRHYRLTKLGAGMLSMWQSELKTMTKFYA
jgi:DNA-binding PadR family transcriptional regulator